MKVYQFLKALHAADTNTWTRFVSMQNHYNLIYREEEREIIPLCREEGIGLTPYSPLAGGRLTRDGSETTVREETDKILHANYDKMADLEAPYIPHPTMGLLEKPVQALN